ncbi:hypothetical protein RJ639_043206 [Escallonia herrerae]|uniref:non-specific serine/threonine protein kinase n=1 Tax=Escallonia herrerae TaxID=1293975 RepID=A0AA88WDD0_9ASTE|nr:hypothetical protein RJ639_043206 [Escallonia herrerae]
MGLLEFWVILIVVRLVSHARVINSQNLTCNFNDSRALEAFMTSLESPIDGWQFNSSSSNCCNWVEITCTSSSDLGHNDSIDSGRVTKLELGGKRLTGKLSDSLGSLEQLKTLNLSRNYLRGSVPVSLFNLPNLEALDLSYNSFSGSVPTSINLPSVQYIDISENSFQGSIPAGICHNSTRIRSLLLAINYFSGNLPPEVGNCSSLEHLCLASNNLAGAIPEDLFRLQKLVQLSLQDNGFSGQLSSTIGNLSNLVRLDVSLNEFSGFIPDVFHRFKSLDYFAAHSNSFIGGLPISLSNSQTISSLSLRNNYLDGSFYLNCSAMTNLVSLDLGTNQFTGSIPDNLSSCPKLRTINLAKSNLSGQIPESFKNFPSLSYLSLSNSSFYNLSSALRILQHCENLTTLVLTLNFRGEELPSDPSLEFKALKALVIANCRLTGIIPPWLSSSTKLQLLDLSWNSLAGTIPALLSDFQFLFYLDLSNNSFTGEIPQNLTRLQSLIFRNISLEEPSPDFPFFMKRNISARGLQKSSKKKGTIIGMAVGIGFGTVFILTLMVLIVLLASSPKAVDPKRKGDGGEKDLEELGSRLVVLFQNKENNKELCLDDLIKSTHSFDQANIIGCGGFGLVYKATLPDGRKVAIKRLSGDTGEMEREFQAEVEVLSRAQHPNLVLLQGYCTYKDDRLLIYSYMENGSLDYWLHEKLDGPSLDWDMRLQIAQGAARGLAYLHQSCVPHILHRDIKSSNILLDDNFIAHLADFGLARLVLPYDTHVTTDLVGTLGYIPPEYGQASVATYKGDVYSFGVVLLEVLTGKRPVDMCRPRESRDLISWVLQMKAEKRESEVFDPFIYNKEHAKQMSWVLEIACLCLNEIPKRRPSSQQLVSWLDNIALNV